jgi:AcrR family transcriptional regulator
LGWPPRLNGQARLGRPIYLIIYASAVGVAKEKLLEAAGRRFYADGIAATGIDAITAEAQVAKMSLYNNFSSKDELVVAYLDRRHAEWLGLLEQRTVRARSAAGRVLAVFDAYLDHAELAYAHGFRGCGLLNGAAELPVDHPGREAVRAHKDEVRRILIERCTAANAPDPQQLGEHLFLLVEGGVVSAGLEGNADRLQRARRLAQLLLTGK